MEICYENGLSMRAPALLSFNKTPDYFLRSEYSSKGKYISQTIMNTRIELYIKTVMTHVYTSKFGKVITSWDIVEAYFHASYSGWQHILL